MNVWRIVLVVCWLFLWNPISADENEYSNPTLGITVTKPDDWHFATAAQVSENLKRVELNDEGFEALMEKHATAPIVALTKFKEPFDDLNPKVEFAGMKAAYMCMD